VAFVGLVFSVAFVFAFGFVLVTLCASIPSTDYNSAPLLSPFGGRCWFILGAQILYVPL
jgi:hypothetical protein